MLKQARVLNSAIVGTTMMTLFSYLFSSMSDTDTREPALLGKMIRRLAPGMSKKHSRAAGWTAHYGVGLLFAELYAQIWEQRSVRANAGTGLVFGGLSGIAAILIWKFTLETHPFAPSVDFTTFAVNLLLAHLVFGFFAAIGYGRSQE